MPRLQSAGLEWENRNLNKFLNDMSKANRGMENVGRAAGGVGPKFSVLTGAITGVSMAITTQLIGALSRAGQAVGGLITDSVGLASQFESMETALNIAGKAAQDQVAEFGGFGEIALAVGGDTRLLGVSATGAADAMTGLLKAGLPLQDVMGDVNAYMNEGAQLGGILRASIDLAAATELDMVRASDLASTTMTQFGISADETTGVMDYFVRAADASVADVSGMAEALNNVGPIMKGFGFSAEESADAIALLSNTGIRGAEAGTALKSMFTNLSRQTPKVTEALEAQGIALTDEHGNYKDLIDIVTQFEIAMEDMTEAEASNFAQTVAGAYGKNALLSIVGQGVEGWTDYKDAVETATGIEAQAEARASTYAGQMEALQGNLETLRIRIGKAFLPILTKVTAWFSDMVSKYSPPVIKMFQNIGSAIGDLVSALIGGDITQASGFFEKLGLDPGWIDTILAIKDAFMDLIGSILGEGFSLKGLFRIEGGDETVGIVRRITDTVKDFLDSFLGVDKLQALGEILQLGGGPAADDAQTGFDKVLEVIRTGKERITEVIRGINDFIYEDFLPAWRETWPKITDFVATYVPIAAEIIRDIARVFSEDVVPVIREVVPQIVEIIGRIFGWLTENAPLITKIIKGIAIAFVSFKVAATIVPIIMGIVNAVGLVVGIIQAGIPIIATIVAILGGPLTVIIGVIIALITALTIAWKTNFLGIRDVVQNALQAVTQFLNTWGEKIVNFFKNLWRKLVGGSIIPEMMAAIKQAIVSVLEAIRDFWQGILNGIVEFTQNIFQGISTWIKEKLETIKSVVETVWEAVKLAWKTAWTTIKTFTTETVASIVSWVGDKLETVKQTISKVWESVKSTWEDTWNAISSFTEDIIETVRSWIRTGIEKAKEVISTTLSTILSIWEDIWVRISSFVEGVWETIKSAVNNAIDLVKEVITAVMQALQGDWEGAWETIKGVAETIWENINTNVETAISAVQEVIATILDTIFGDWEAKWGEIKDSVSGIWEDINEAVGEKTEELLTFIGEWLIDIKEAITDYATNLISAGRDLIGGAIQGIQERAQDVIGAITGVFGDALGAVGNLLEMGSPSRVMMEIARDMLEGLIQGWKEKSPEVLEHVKDLVNEVVSTLSSLIELGEKLEGVGNVLSRLGLATEGGEPTEAYTRIEETLKALSEWGKRVLEVLADIGETFPKLEGDAKKALAKITAATEILSEMIDSLLNFSDMLTAIIYLDLGELANIGRADIMKDILGTVYALTTWADNLYEAFRDNLGPMIDNLDDATEAVLSGVSRFTDTLSDFLSSFMELGDVIKEVLATNLGQLSDMEAHFEKIETYITTMAEWLRDLYNALGNTGGEVGILSNTLDKVSEATWHSVSKISAMAQTMTSFLSSLLDMAAVLREIAITPAVQPSEKITPTIETIIERLEDLYTSIGDLAQTTLPNLSEAAGIAMTALTDAVGTLSEFIDSLSSFATLLLELEVSTGEVSTDGVLVYIWNLLDELKWLHDALGNMARVTLPDLDLTLNAAMASIIQTVQTLSGFIQSMAGFHQTLIALQQAVEPISSADVLTYIWDLMDELDWLHNALGNMARVTLNDLDLTLNYAIVSITDTIATLQTMINSLLSFADTLVDLKAQAQVTNVTVSEVKDWLDTLFDEISDVITAFEQVKDNLPELPLVTKATINELLNATSVIKGLITGLSDFSAKLELIGEEVTILERKDIEAWFDALFAQTNTIIQAFTDLKEELPQLSGTIKATMDELLETIKAVDTFISTLGQFAESIEVLGEDLPNVTQEQVVTYLTDLIAYLALIHTELGTLATATLPDLDRSAESAMEELLEATASVGNLTQGLLGLGETIASIENLTVSTFTKEDISGFLENLADWVEHLHAELATAANDVLPRIDEAASEALNALKDATSSVKGLTDGLLGLGSTIGGIEELTITEYSKTQITALFTRLIGWMEHLHKKLGELAENTLPDLSETAENAIAELTKATSTINGLLKNLLEMNKAMTEIVEVKMVSNYDLNTRLQVLKSNVDTITRNMSDIEAVESPQALTAVKDAVDSLAQSIEDFGNLTVAKLLSALENLASRTVVLSATMAEAIQAAVTAAVKDIQKLIRAIESVPRTINITVRIDTSGLDDLENEISSAMSGGKEETKKYAEEMGDAAARGIKDRLKIKSPSEVFSNIAGDMVRGLVDRLKASKGDVAAAGSALGSSLAAAVTNNIGSTTMAAIPTTALAQTTNVDRSRTTTVEVNPTYENVQSPSSIYYDVEAALAAIAAS